MSAPGQLSTRSSNRAPSGDTARGRQGHPPATTAATAAALASQPAGPASTSGVHTSSPSIPLSSWAHTTGAQTAAAASPPATSFSQHYAAAASRSGDPCALLLFTAAVSVIYSLSRGLQPHEHLWFCAAQAALSAMLLWRCLWPGSYIRHRSASVAALRLLLTGRALAVDTFATLGPQPGKDGCSDSGHFAVALLVGSGVPTLLQPAWGLPLPPVLALIVQLCSTAALGATNPSACATRYARCDVSRHSLAAIYNSSWAAMPVQLLERMGLLAAGMGPDQSARQCTAVLASLQFYLALVLPTVLVTQAQCKAYLTWREPNGHGSSPGRETSGQGVPHLAASGRGSSPGRGGTSGGRQGGDTSSDSRGHGMSLSEDWQFEAASRAMEQFGLRECALLLVAALYWYCCYGSVPIPSGEGGRDTGGG